MYRNKTTVLAHNCSGQVHNGVFIHHHLSRTRTLFFIFGELRGKKSKKDDLLFPGVFLFIRARPVFWSVAYFYFYSSFSSPILFFYWLGTVVEPGTKGGIFYGSSPIVGACTGGYGRAWQVICGGYGFVGLWRFAQEEAALGNRSAQSPASV